MLHILIKNSKFPYFPEHFRQGLNRVAAATLAIFILLFSAGCSPAQNAVRSLPRQVPESSSELSTGLHIKIAVPFFEHGGGYGSFSSMAIVPPAFITEAEASKLFNRIAAEFDLDFDQTKKIEIGKVETALYLYDEFKPAQTDDGVMQVSLDGYSDAIGFAYEFISVDDVSKMQCLENEVMVFSTVTYAFRHAASLLLNEINSEEAEPNTAVFYDPCLSYNDIADDNNLYLWDKDEYAATAKQVNMQALEQQIRDFFEWLKAQEII